MARQIAILSTPDIRRRVAAAVQSAPDGYVVEIRRPTRSLRANARLWAMLRDISEQVEWYGKRLTPEEWKHVFSAALKKYDMVPGIDGGFVVLGQSTSSYTSAEMSDLQELMQAFGAERGVRFSAPEQGL